MARWLQEGGFSNCGKSMIEGEAAPAIAQFIAAGSIDLIVLSTSARLRASRIAFGSVAEEIFRKATCPVFVLGPKVRASKRPLTRLVFATDLEPHSLAALPHLSGFARKFNCSVSVIRAADPDIQSHLERSRHQKRNRREDRSRRRSGSPQTHRQDTGGVRSSGGSHPQFCKPPQGRRDCHGSSWWRRLGPGDHSHSMGPRPSHHCPGKTSSSDHPRVTWQMRSQSRNPVRTPD